MKKLLGVVLAGLMSFSCVACGEPTKETAVCKLVPSDAVGVAYEITLEAENDIVQTLTQLGTFQLEYFSQDDVDALDEYFVACENRYEYYKGVQYEGYVEDGVMYETICIDMTNSNTVDSLRENGLLPIEGEANKTSLDKTVEKLESLGWEIEMK